MIVDYYNNLAPYYRLLFEDWEASVTRQGTALDGVIREFIGAEIKTILDAACGIGTQSIGLAQRGYKVTGSDISSGAVAQARAEASRRGLQITFGIADMRDLARAYSDQFDLVIACDNAIPHLLSDDEIRLAFEQFYRCTGPGGACMLSVRDYESMEKGGTRIVPRQIHGTREDRVLVFDVWEFKGNYYDFTTYVVEEMGDQKPETRTIRGGRYYCVTLQSLAALLKGVGFKEVHILKDRYFQPLLVGRK